MVGCPLGHLDDPDAAYALKLFLQYERGCTPTGVLADETAFYRDLMETLEGEFAAARASALEHSKSKKPRT